MSIIRAIDEVCANCNTPASYKVFLSWNSLLHGSKRRHGFDQFGPDVPQECPHCGYVSMDIEKNNNDLTPEEVEKIKRIVKEKYPILSENHSKRPYITLHEINKYKNKDLETIAQDLGFIIYHCKASLRFKKVRNSIQVEEEKNSKDFSILIKELEETILELEPSKLRSNLLDLLRELKEFDFIIDVLEVEEDLSSYDQDILDRAINKDSRFAFN